MRSMLAVIAVLALAQAVAAQEKAEDQGREGEGKAVAEERATPRPAIRVLQNPYDLASFYRSGGSAPEGWAGLTANPDYAIAGFYRSREGGQRSRYGWSQFWTGGYGARRPAPFLGYRRTIGENGDLFLVVPYLASVGPISGAFFSY
jgi:hypothetical protein